MEGVQELSGGECTSTLENDGGESGQDIIDYMHFANIVPQGMANNVGRAEPNSREMLELIGREGHRLLEDSAEHSVEA